MMKMKTVFWTLFVFLLGIAAGAVFFLNRKIPKEPARYVQMSARVNDNALKWLNDRKKLSACEDDAAQLRKTVESGRQELAVKTDLEKKQADVRAVLARQKAALDAQEDEFRGEATKLHNALVAGTQEAVHVPPKANVVDNRILNKTITDLKDKVSSLKDKVSSVEKMSDDLRKDNRQLAQDNNKLKHLNSVLNANAAKAKLLIAKLEQKAEAFFRRAIGKELLEKKNAQLNKVVSLLSKEHVTLNDQIDDLKNKIAAQRAENVNYYTEAGNFYMQNSLYDKAIEVYNKAAKIDPNDPEVQLRLGFLYKRVQDQPKEAISHFKQYLLLAPHAKNRKEVQYIIEMLSTNSNSDWSNN
jgi:tetratricopeptide (TPR) repeat protein